MKPYFKWVGSKGRLADQILPYLGVRCRRYHEPFVGCGAIFFALPREFHSCPPSLSDVNVALINTHRNVAGPGARHVQAALCRLEEEQVLHASKQIFFVKLKARLNEAIARGPSGEEDAALLIAFLQLNFNGLWRVNKTGALNVPIGWTLKRGVKSGRQLRVPDLREHGSLLEIANINVAPFLDLPCAVLKGDVVYCDPPFLKQFSGYDHDGFDVDMHRALAAQARAWAAKGARVVVSSSDVPLAYEIYGEPATTLGRQDCVGVGARVPTRELLFVYGKVAT